MVALGTLLTLLLLLIDLRESLKSIQNDRCKLKEFNIDQSSEPHHEIQLVKMTDKLQSCGPNRCGIIGFMVLCETKQNETKQNGTLQNDVAPE